MNYLLLICFTMGEESGPCTIGLVAVAFRQLSVLLQGMLTALQAVFVALRYLRT